MSYSKFLITESKKKQILGMYGLLNEQFVAPNGGTSQVINKYPAGYYSLDGTDKSGTAYDNTSKLKPIIDSAIAFLTKNKGYIPRVVINAGESIIPNYDTEGGTGQKSIGWLSQKRKDKIKQQSESFETIEIGSNIPKIKNKLKSVDGDMYSIMPVKENNGLIVIFTCNTCPFVVMWEDRYKLVEEIAKDKPESIIRSKIEVAVGSR